MLYRYNLYIYLYYLRFGGSRPTHNMEALPFIKVQASENANFNYQIKKKYCGYNML